MTPSGVTVRGSGVYNGTKMRGVIFLKIDECVHFLILKLHESAGT